MTMMLVHQASKKRTFALEGPCRAPLQATPEKVAAAPRKSGYKAVAVPANPAVLDYVLRTYGSMSVRDVCKPAIRFAERGIPVTYFHYQHTLEYLGGIKKGNAVRFLLGPDSKPLPVGAILKQEQLATTLRRLADAGFDDFYRGDIA